MKQIDSLIREDLDSLMSVNVAQLLREGERPSFFLASRSFFTYVTFSFFLGNDVQLPGLLPLFKLGIVLGGRHEAVPDG